MQRAAFAAGARSTLAGPPLSVVGAALVGAAPDTALGVVPLDVAHDVLRDALAELSIALSGTVARAPRSTHAAAFAAGARSTFVPVVLSRVMTGADPPAVEAPPGRVAHVVARSTAVAVPTTPFARRHAAAETIGAAETLVPVRDEVTVVSPDPDAVDGPVPQSVESDACATGSVETVDGAGLVTSPRRQRAATAAPPEVTVVPVIPFEASTCPPLPAPDAPPLHSELSTACDG
jgi:hypothetical protein